MEWNKRAIQVSKTNSRPHQCANIHSEGWDQIRRTGILYYTNALKCGVTASRPPTSEVQSLRYLGKARARLSAWHLSSSSAGLARS